MVSNINLHPLHNGGIGTFYSALAEALAGAGHGVTLLYTQGTMSHSPGKDFEHWREEYAVGQCKLDPGLKAPGFKV